jgi:hypothetical protein
MSRESNPVQPSQDPKYLTMMDAAKQNLLLSLQRLIAEDPFFQALSNDKKDQFHNLTLTRDNLNVRANIPCFDDFWTMIKTVFDQARDATTSQKLDQCVQDFKKIILFLIQAGMPFVDGKEVAFWSTRYAKKCSTEYVHSNPALIDSVTAQTRLKKILLRWPKSELVIFHPALKTPGPAYPELSQVYWSAVSQCYGDQITPGGRAHLFFQNSITIGNYCWNNELPIVHQKQAALILHRYDTQTQRWSQLRMDSAEADLIPLQRRRVHPTDSYDPSTDAEKTQLECGVLIWKQTFESDKLDAPLVSWPAPTTLTIGKMRKICHFFVEKTARPVAAVSEAAVVKSPAVVVAVSDSSR